MNTYARQPVEFVRGEGAWLFDAAGRRYLDAVAGVAVCILGHAHPRLAEALADQARTLIHTSNLYRIPLQEELGDRLTALAGMDNVFFCNSGAEANEAAIKLVRLYGHARGIDVPRVVTFQGSFHGRTMATLSATGNAKVQDGFAPLVEGFVHLPWADLDALAGLGDDQGIAAVLVEPVQGEGGVKVAPAGMLAGLREICDARGWLLMVDEVQTGMGRTGRWFGCQHEQVVPDVMTLAKALGSGVPIGACLARGKAAALMAPGRHGSTFGGNPLACRAGLTVIDVIESEGLLDRARVLGERIVAGFRTALADCPRVREVRGRGLMIGIETDVPCGSLVDAAREQGVLINVTAERVVRLVPPLVLTDEDATLLVDTVAPLIAALPEC